MKRKPQLTKKEKKALAPPRPQQAQQHNHQHIHCIACGRHLDENEFESPATATLIKCDHGSQFPSCVRCVAKSEALVAEHDRTSQPVKSAPAFH